jgi:hypothetical protein
MYIITQSSGYRLEENIINLCVVSTEEKAKEIISDLLKLRESLKPISLKIDEYRLELSKKYNLPNLPQKPSMNDELKRLYSIPNRTLDSDKDRFKVLQKEHIDKINNWRIEYDKIYNQQNIISSQINKEINKIEKANKVNCNLPSKLVDIVFEYKNYEVKYDYDEILFCE